LRKPKLIHNPLPWQKYNNLWVKLKMERCTLTVLILIGLAGAIFENNNKLNLNSKLPFSNYFCYTSIMILSVWSSSVRHQNALVIYEVLMGTMLVVTSYKYSTSSRYLKIFYNNGSAELYHPVPEFIYNNLLRSSDKAAFVHKYLEYDLHFTRVSID